MSALSPSLDDLNHLPKKRPRRSDLAFLPAAMEIVETPASPSARATYLTIVVFIAIVVAWACIGRLDVVAVAEGRVIPVGQVKVVQPLEPGIVRALHVDEGDHVSAGQVLVELDPTEAQANLEQLRYDRNQALLDREGTAYLLDPARGFAAIVGVDAQQAEATRVRIEDELARHTASIASIDSQRVEKEAAVGVNLVEIDKLEKLMPLLQERFEALRTLHEKQLVQQPPYLQIRQELIERTAQLGAAKERSRQLQAELRSLASRRDEILATFRATQSERQLAALQRAFSLDQQIKKEQQREDRRRLTAPVDGTILGLKVTTLGGVVTAADILMTVIPDNSPVEVEAHVANKDIGYVGEGMAVEVKLETYSFTRYGTVQGNIRKLGRDALRQSTPDGRQGGELLYPMRIALDRSTIDVDGVVKPITPGMKVIAEVKTEQRRIVELFLDRALVTLKEAGRER